MASITEFLEARIAEDEHRESRKFKIKTERIDVYAMGPDYVDLRGKDGARERRLTIPEFEDEYGEPAPDKRVLAECAAKRAIIAEHGLDDHSTKDYCETCADWWNSELGEGPPPVAWPCPTLRAIAAVYAGHPDYQQEWMPRG